MKTAEEIDELIARLRSLHMKEVSDGVYCREQPVPINPDGPEAATALEALRAERDALKVENEHMAKRGSQAVIAYHVAICSPKGVIPVDELYDPVIAAKVEQYGTAARKALGDQHD